VQHWTTAPSLRPPLSGGTTGHRQRVLCHAAALCTDSVQAAMHAPGGAVGCAVQRQWRPRCSGPRHVLEPPYAPASRAAPRTTRRFTRMHSPAKGRRRVHSECWLPRERAIAVSFCSVCWRVPRWTRRQVGAANNVNVTTVTGLRRRRGGASVAGSDSGVDVAPAFRLLCPMAPTVPSATRTGARPPPPG
jgi:hypothetical protein